jgi:anaerobic magnesium-protoporphyrin IX monomethyl ester cyclase
MKVAIIAPPYPLEEAPAPPLGVTYVAAAFEAAGAEVRIFDYIVSRYTPEKLKVQLDEFRPDAVGATSVTMNFKDAAEIVQRAKEHDPSIVTMMGGPHVSFDTMNSMINYPGIDMIVRGEGEDTISELTPLLKDNDEWDKVRGIVFKRDGEIIFTEPRGWIEDLDKLPMPARHLLPMSRYQALGFPVSITTSRGCPYSCIFCQGRRMVGSRVRLRSSDSVVDEIEHVLSYGIDRINVADDLFTANKERVKDICGKIKERGLKFAWSAFARVNTVDRETLKIMRDTGCDSVSFGVESGNQEILKNIKKGITLDQVRQAVNLCRELGIIAHTSFVVGLPGESPATLNETKRFAANLGSLYGYHFLAPFPGTTVRENVEEYDLEILTDDWNLYDANRAIVRTSELSPQQINSFVKEFEDEIDKEWQKMVRRYRENQGRPTDDMRVEGNFRMKLVYKMLAWDLVEKLGTFPLDAIGYETANMLSLRIEDETAAEPVLVRKLISEFVQKGYIKSRIANGKLIWYWTRNRYQDL